MKLISCDNCAVILDADKIAFPYDITDEDGCIDDNKAKYNQNTKEFNAYIQCPVCGEVIFKEQ